MVKRSRARVFDWRTAVQTRQCFSLDQTNVLKNANNMAVLQQILSQITCWGSSSPIPLCKLRTSNRRWAPRLETLAPHWESFITFRGFCILLPVSGLMKTWPRGKSRCLNATGPIGQYLYLIFSEAVTLVQSFNVKHQFKTKQALRMVLFTALKLIFNGYVDRHNSRCHVLYPDPVTYLDHHIV